ncbi:MAG: TonB-dependent receptor [Alphaproteobacteria bacterium]|nr:TonB-dependent receptor [Alphaproteobacteria bacterium]
MFILSSRKTRALSGASLSVLGALMLAGPAAAQTTAPVQLGPVSVNDNADKNNNNHAPAMSNFPSSSIQDTPQAVNVIDSATMKQQAVTTLGDALRNVPGITIAIGEGGTLAGDQFRIRGFDAKDDIYLDGLRDFGAYTRDSFNYEEVQVLKGPSGLMFGRGTTGGAINTISKTPFLRDRYNVAVEGGNGGHVRGTADLNYALSDTAAVRLNLMVTDTGVVDRDFTHSTRWGIAPTITLGLGTDTQWSLGYMHQHTSAHPDYGLTVAQRPANTGNTANIAEPVSEYGVPRNTNTQFFSDIDRNDADIGTMKWAHQAAPWLTLTNDTRAAAYSRYFQYTTVDTCEFAMVPNTGTSTNYCSAVVFGQVTPTSAAGTADPRTALGQIGGSGPYQQNSWGAQDVFTAKADFNVGGFRNIAIAGIDASYQNADRTIFAYSLPTTAQFTYTLGNHTPARRNIGISLYNPTHISPPGYNVVFPTAALVATGLNSDTATSVATSSGHSTDLAFFATDRLYVTPEISVIGGVRVDRYTPTFASTVVGTVATGQQTTIARSPQTLVNPRAALVYEPSEDQTYYFSYGKSSVPQGTSIVGSPTPITTANQALDPELSETLEIGAKKSFFDGALGLSGSVFKVLKANSVITDPVSGISTAQSGEKDRVQGLEFSATGQITEQWNIIGAYTFLDSKVTSDNFCNTTTLVCAPNPYTIGTQVIFVPKNAFSLWSSYKLDAFVPGLGIGGGAVYQSKLFARNTTAGTAPVATSLSRVAVIPRTLEFDAVATYDIQQFHFQFNVNNISNELNYTQSFGNRGTPSAGRTYIISAGVNL